MTQKTYKLIPLSGSVGMQLVDGYQLAREIACDITSRESVDVVVSDSDGHAIVWLADGTHRCAFVGEVTPDELARH